ncbi:MAG TPA: HAD family hydrolase [Verrucomicrobiae bacterium]|nr:HAD family hydrolase [Verrucomicrobiae bacterium]
MKFRAVIFDVYNTILEVGAPPAGSAERWKFLWEAKLADPPRLTLEEFAARCQTIVTREHAAARAVGVPHPEVFWPAVAREALPELGRLNESELDDFLYQHTQMQRSIRLMSGAAEVLGGFAKRSLPLGIASNSQPYTLRELDAALGSARLSRNLFNPDLCFWSFASGFSKPDPHVFRFLAARLNALGISTSETLIVADRLDNDVAPAGAQGFQTWHFQSAGGAGETGGDWRQLGQLFSQRIEN